MSILEIIAETLKECLKPKHTASIHQCSNGFNNRQGIYIHDVRLHNTVAARLNSAFVVLITSDEMLLIRLWHDRSFKYTFNLNDPNSIDELIKAIKSFIISTEDK